MRYVTRLEAIVRRKSSRKKFKRIELLLLTGPFVNIFTLFMLILRIRLEFNFQNREKNTYNWRKKNARLGNSNKWRSIIETKKERKLTKVKNLFLSNFKMDSLSRMKSFKSTVAVR